MSDYRRKVFLEALKNRTEEERAKREKERFLKRNEDKAKNLAKGDLDKEKMLVKGEDIVEDHTPKVNKVSKADKIDTVGKKAPVTDIDDFVTKLRIDATMKDATKRGDKAMIKKLSKLYDVMAKRGIKSVPLIGGIVSGLAAGDASAAVPLLGDSDNVGMSPEEEDMFLAEQDSKNKYLRSQARLDAIRNKK